jgi:hypothetical protein
MFGPCLCALCSYYIKHIITNPNLQTTCSRVSHFCSGSSKMSWTIASFILLLYTVAAQALLLQFPFGNATGDALARTADRLFSVVPLPINMTFVGRTINTVQQARNGFISLHKPGAITGGKVSGFLLNDIFEINRVGSNELWMRVGNRTNDLTLARDIISGTGNTFTPQATVVATWNRVLNSNRVLGTSAFTFQIAIPYSASGETWVIFAYGVIPFLTSNLGPFIEVENSAGLQRQFFLAVDNGIQSNQLLNGTNCNRSGVYAFQVNAAPTQSPTHVPTEVSSNIPTQSPTHAPTHAPTDDPSNSPTQSPTKTPTKATTNPPTKSPIQFRSKAPTKPPVPGPVMDEVVVSIPTKCGLLGRRIFCPITFCGVLGRWLDLCQTS